jgi:hypothetical protein
MSFDCIKRDETFTSLEPSRKEKAAPNLNRPTDRPDGRTKRKAGRTKQFNPRVTPEYMERFTNAKAEEVSRLGEDITQAYFLELLLATFERAGGKEDIKPFGLPEPAFDAAKAIAEHMGWSLSAVIEDAIAAQFRRFSIANPAKTKTR